MNAHVSPRVYEENRQRALTPRQRAEERAQVRSTQRRIAQSLWVLHVECWFLAAMQSARAAEAFPRLRPVLTEQELADRACEEFGVTPWGVHRDGAQAGVPAAFASARPWPPLDVGADFEALRRHAGTWVVAEVLRIGEEQDLALFGAEIASLTDTAELWAKAQRIYDEETRLKRDLTPLRVVEQRGGEPGPVSEALARMEAHFGAARESCRTGHVGGEGPTCTYGGPTPTGGYWLAADVCRRTHGEKCQLHGLCEGAPTATRFAGWGGGHIWGVYACRACADAFRQVHPEWRAA